MMNNPHRIDASPSQQQIGKTKIYPWWGEIHHSTRDYPHHWASTSMQLAHTEIRHTPRLGPPINHRPHTPRPAIRPHRIRNLQPVQQGFAGIPRSLGDDAHPTVIQVRGAAGQPQLVGLAIHPPPKPDPLHIAMHPRRQPHHVTAHASSLAAPACYTSRTISP